MATETQHMTGCARVFRTYDKSCPRCKELAAGALPRAGYGDRGRQQAADSLRWLRAHDCRVAGCGPVCTYGDW